MTRSERGIAIPTVLVSLVALTALGLAMSIATRSEVVVSGVHQRSMESFHAADGGLNYSLGLPANFNNPASTAPYSTKDRSLPFAATVRVDYLPPVRLPPPGLRVSALKVASYHFLLTSVGEVQRSGNENTVTGLEMEASKLGPQAAGGDG